MAVRPLARRQRRLTPVFIAAHHPKCVAMAQEPALYCRIGSMSPSGRTSTMRWKLRPSGHDPRQIDLLAALAILIVIAAVGHYLSGPAKTRVTSSFIEPSQSVRW
jgi:hypothetical protein